MVFGYTEYFDSEVLRKRPYIDKAWCEHVVAHFERREVQPNGRVRCARISELGGRYLRAITLEDGRTIHSAFPDRGFNP